MLVMEELLIKALANFDVKSDDQSETDSTEVIRSLRDVRPADYLFKIKNFSSLLSNPKIEKYDSTDFEVSGFKWKLRVHPKGNKKVINENDKHISLYLVLSESNEFTFHTELNVYFKLFVYNQILDKYLTVQDANGKTSRFRGTKTKWGFDQFLPLDVFNDASNGYLIDDCCIFGAELYVVEPISKGECATVLKGLDFSNNAYTWNVQNFAKLVELECHVSDVFSIGGYYWSLWLYPNGYLLDKGKNLSFYLQLEDVLDHGQKLSADFVLHIKDQLTGKYYDDVEDENQLSHQFSESTSWFWGVPDFIPLSKLNDTSNGFLINDIIVLEVEISCITMIKEFS